MKIKMSFKSVALLIFCFVFLFGGSFFYLEANIDKKQAAQQNENDIPYTFIPEDVTLKIITDTEKYLLFLDFGGGKSLFTTDECEGEADYIMHADYDFTEGLIDLLGGITLCEYRRTGIEITDMLKENQADCELKKEIIIKIFEVISKNGFSNDGFSYIIENGNTDLTVPLLMKWENYIKPVFSNTEVIL